MSPPPELPEVEKRRLIAEAMAPLTPAEREQYEQNRVNDLLGGQLKAKIREIAQAIRAWQKTAVARAVQQGLIPQHVVNDSRPEAVNQWMQEAGFHFTGNAFHHEFRKGARVLSVFDVKVNGKPL